MAYELCSKITYKFTLTVLVETIPELLTRQEHSLSHMFNRRVLLALSTVSMEKQKWKMKKCGFFLTFKQRGQLYFGGEIEL